MPNYSIKRLAKPLFVSMLIVGGVVFSNCKGITAADDLSLALASNSLKTYVSTTTLSSVKLQQIPEKIASQASMTFNAMPNTVEKINRYVDANDQSAFIEVNPVNQTVLFTKGIQTLQTPQGTSNLLKGNNATKIVETHLKDLGLYPADPTQLVQLKQGAIMLGVYNKTTGQTATYQKTTTLRFTRTLNGLPVKGPGSRIVVDLGSNGSLEGLVWNWHEVTGKTVASAEVFSQNQLQTDVKKRLGSLKNLKSSQQKLVLYDDGTGNIEPVYQVEATLSMTNNGKNVSSLTDFYVPVLKATKLNLQEVNVKQPLQTAN